MKALADKDLEVIPQVSNKELSKELEEAGFKLASKIMAHDYPAITPAAIQGYLRKKATEFARARLPWWRRNHISIYSDSILTARLVIRSQDTYQIAWKEDNIATYPGIPPRYIIQRVRDVQEEKTDLSLRIVTVEISQVPLPDPLLVGILPRDENRYLIDWWDHDINPLDLVEIK